MTMDEVRNLVRHYVDEVWNHANMAALQELTAPEFKYYLGGQPARDRAGTGQFIQGTHTAFPDWHVEIAELIVEGNLAVVRWHGQATHLGAFQGIGPTGRRITVTGINVYRITGNQIATEWEQTDTLGILRQLGVISPV